MGTFAISSILHVAYIIVPFFMVDPILTSTRFTHGSGLSTVWAPTAVAVGGPDFNTWQHIRLPFSSSRKEEQRRVCRILAFGPHIMLQVCCMFQLNINYRLNSMHVSLSVFAFLFSELVQYNQHSLTVLLS